MKKILNWLFLGLFFWTHAQTQAQDSTAKVLSLSDFLRIVEVYHPVAKQSALIPDQARYNLQRAMGAFDPYFYTYADNKTYKGKNYYNLWETGFKIPTWYGIDGKVEYSQNGGTLLNPENSLPGNGLITAGVSIPLAQGLLIDQRRTIVRQAKVFQESAEWERVVMLNELFYDAAATYWEWVAAYNELQMIQQAYSLTSQRLQAVKSVYELGDRPSIDTLEAYVQLQNRVYELNQEKVRYLNAGLVLSTYLWKENDVPVELTDRIIPPSLSDLSYADVMREDSVVNLIQQSNYLHPYVRIYKYKLQTLELERRWKTEKLKPKIYLDYNLLTQEVGKSDFLAPKMFVNNYKIGLSVGFPLLLRSERGDLALTNVKIYDTEFELQNQQRNISNKIRTYYNEMRNLHDQILVYRDITRNYKRLLDAEETKFRLGESSIFLINSRETKWLEAQQKWIEIQSKYYKSLATIVYAAGQFYTPVEEIR